MTCSPDWLDCDVCGERGYTETNPFVECRTRRPSDPSDLCCIMAGHSVCIHGAPREGEATPEKPYLGDTPADWEAYLVSPEAVAAGYLFLG